MKAPVDAMVDVKARAGAGVVTAVAGPSTTAPAPANDRFDCSAPDRLMLMNGAAGPETVPKSRFGAVVSDTGTPEPAIAAPNPYSIHTPFQENRRNSRFDCNR